MRKLCWSIVYLKCKVCKRPVCRVGVQIPERLYVLLQVRTIRKYPYVLQSKVRIPVFSQASANDAAIKRHPRFPLPGTTRCCDAGSLHRFCNNRYTRSGVNPGSSLFSSGRGHVPPTWMTSTVSPRGYLCPWPSLIIPLLFLFYLHLGPSLFGLMELIYLFSPGDQSGIVIIQRIFMADVTYVT